MPGESHHFEVGPNGAVFYNISHWKDPFEMDSATRKYIGQPLGAMHAEALKTV